MAMAEQPMPSARSKKELANEWYGRRQAQKKGTKSEKNTRKCWSERNGNDDSFLKTIHVFDCYSVHNSTDNPTYRRATSHELYLYNWNVCARCSQCGVHRPPSRCERPQPLTYSCPDGIFIFCCFCYPRRRRRRCCCLRATTNFVAVAVNVLSALLLFLAFNSRLNRKSTVRDAWRILDMRHQTIEYIVWTAAAVLRIEINVVMYDVLLSADIVIYAKCESKWDGLFHSQL